MWLLGIWKMPATALNLETDIVDYYCVRIIKFLLCFLEIDKEEVSLRRVIGAKKDQYFLDKKMVT